MLGCGQMLVLSVLMKHASAAAILRPALGLLLVLNLLPLCLLVVDLRSTLSRIYTRWELCGVGALALGGGLLVPLCLLLCCGQLSFHAWRSDVYCAGKSAYPLRDHQVAACFPLSMRGNT